MSRLSIEKCAEGTYRVTAGDSSTEMEKLCDPNNKNAKTFNITTANARLGIGLTDSGTLKTVELWAGYFTKSNEFNQLFQLFANSSPTEDQKSFVQEASRCFLLLKSAVVAKIYIVVENGNTMVECGNMTPMP